MNGVVKRVARPLWLGLPDGARRRLIRWRLDSREIVRRRGVTISIGKAQLGGTRGHGAVEFGLGIGDPDWAATPLVAGPHADLYRRFAESTDTIDWRDPTIPYVALAIGCIDGFGEFCGCRDLDEVVELVVHRKVLWDADNELDVSPDVGRALVRPIRGTDRWEVVDGHHRLCRAWQRGATTAQVDVTWSTSPDPGVRS